MPGPTIIAVDWSGAKTTNRKSGIWIVAIRDGRIVHDAAASRRAEAVAFVQECTPPVIAGFDFSFGVPAWFAAEHDCANVDDVWSLAQRDGERWLARPLKYPFWEHRSAVPRAQQFRRCEERIKLRWRLQPKSLFSLVGAGQVGAGSIRGMPHLATLRGAGHAIWPFDAASERTVVEIYPSLMRKLAPQYDLTDGNPHRRDAIVSAYAMWEHRDVLAALPVAADPVTLIEGDVCLS